LEVDGIIVDITADQFLDHPYPIIVSEDHLWHSSFYGEERSSDGMQLFAEKAKQHYRQAYKAVKQAIGQ